MENLFLATVDNAIIIGVSAGGGGHGGSHNFDGRAEIHASFGQNIKIFL